MKLHELKPIIDQTRVIIISDSENNLHEVIFDFVGIDRYYCEVVLEIYGTLFDKKPALAISLNI